MSNARSLVDTYPDLRIRLSISVLTPAPLAASPTEAKQATNRSTGLLLDV